MTRLFNIFLKQLLILILCVTAVSFTFASTGSIKGKVTDKLTGEQIPFANITYQVNKKTLGVQTGFDGYYLIDSIPVGDYKISASYLGYKTLIKKVTIEEGKTIELNFKFDTASIVLENVVAAGGSKRKKGKRKKVKVRSPKALSRPIGVAGPSGPAGADGRDGHKGNNKAYFNREGYDEITENKFHNVKNEPQSTFSIDVDAASYSNVRRMINQGQKPLESAVRIEEMINYFDYDYPGPENTDPFNVITELAQCPWNDKHQLLHIGLQGKKIHQSNLPPSNLVFLIDVSGSMDEENKLPLLIQSFKLLVNQLRPQDQVAIVVYAGSSGLALSSTKGSDKEKIIEPLESLKAGGSTAGGHGIELAYKIAKENYIEDGNNRVILATDGDFNMGVTSDGELVKLIEKKRKEGVFLSILGFGMGNYQDAKMQKLANKGNGNHYYIDGIAEAKKVLVTEFSGTLFTIAKDVKLQLEFNPAKIAGYRLIGYENRLLENQDFKDDKKDAGELGAGHTVTALYEIIPAGIESQYLVDDEDLKYQKKENAFTSTDLLTLKLRYKKPRGIKSRLMEIPVEANSTSLKQSSSAFQFAAGVAQFGMLLRNSEFKHKANFNNTVDLIKNNIGEDPNGLRADFLTLVKKVKEM